MAPEEPSQGASAGHKMGQLVGEWFEEYFVLPLLDKLAGHLELYLDHRFRSRPARGDKILWRDEDNNSVDYDFVLELGGTDSEIGIPLAFFECFWRRGSRHSKDKARDDSGKLLPMKQLYPTARMLGIVAAGDFTHPARELILSRGIDLFYVPKDKIVTAFSRLGLQIDYPDSASEPIKERLGAEFGRLLTADTKTKAAKVLRNLIGRVSVQSYIDRARASLGALPQEIRLSAVRSSAPRIFESIPDAARFLEKPDFDFSQPTETFRYGITYTDGSEFERDVPAIDDLRELHRQIEKLAEHMTSLLRTG